MKFAICRFVNRKCLLVEIVVVVIVVNNNNTKQLITLGIESFTIVFATSVVVLVISNCELILVSY